MLEERASDSANGEARAVLVLAASERHVARSATEERASDSANAAVS